MKESLSKIWNSPVDEEKTGIYLWIKKSLEITSGWRRALLSSLDEESVELGCG